MSPLPGFRAGVHLFPVMGALLRLPLPGAWEIESRGVDNRYWLV